MKKIYPLFGICIFAISFLYGCGSKEKTARQLYEEYCVAHPMYEGSFEEWQEDITTGNYERLESYEKVYNIIYACATVPTVLSALYSIQDGHDTYAMVERGSTYAGIAQVEHFYNLGFDPKSNVNWTPENFNKVCEQVKQLNKYGHEHFNFYTGHHWFYVAPAVIGNAKIDTRHFTISINDDGLGTYLEFYKYFIENKEVSPTKDEPYDLFLKTIDKAKNIYNNFISKSDNVLYDCPITWVDPWAIATLDNVCFNLQDKDMLDYQLSRTGQYPTKLKNVFDEDSSETQKVNTKIGSISNNVAKLNEKQKENYLKLVFGNYYNDTYNALTRTQIEDGTPVPQTKMVFIPGLIKNFQKVATDPKNGIGKLTGELPSSYSELDDKYKIDLLFDQESDYNSFLAILNNDEYWPGSPTDEQKKAAQREVFNYLLDYMFILKWTYKMYGNKYDIILKGHPAEVIDRPQDWLTHYETDGYNFDKLMSGVAVDFHHNNSIGKYMGMVPYGTAAENLAYLNIDISLGGLPSSTYSGYETSVPVEFVLNLIDGSIADDNNLKTRYENGTLFYYDGEETKTTRFINKGKFYEIMRNRFKPTDSMYDVYDVLRTNWLKSVTGKEDVTGYTIDDQSFWHAPTI